MTDDDLDELLDDLNIEDIIDSVKVLQKDIEESTGVKDVMDIKAYFKNLHKAKNLTQKIKELNMN